MSPIYVNSIIYEDLALTYIDNDVSGVDSSVLRNQTTRNNSLDNNVTNRSIVTSNDCNTKLSSTFRSKHFNCVFDAVGVNTVYRITWKNFYISNAKRYTIKF